MNILARLGRGFLQANAQALDNTVRSLPQLVTLLPPLPLAGEERLNIFRTDSSALAGDDSSEVLRADISGAASSDSGIPCVPSIRSEASGWQSRFNHSSADSHRHYSASQSDAWHNHHSVCQSRPNDVERSRWMSSVPVSLEDTEGANGHREAPVQFHTEAVDPFSLVADELTQLGTKMRNMIATEVPKLAQAAEYFFRLGAEGKRFRPTVLLLMASAVSTSVPEGHVAAEGQSVRDRQRRIAEITEMIHVASLLHDDVLDSSDTRRGISSLNFLMGNKLAVLAGDFLLARASVALASLRNVEVIELLSRVLEHLVSGEIMQMTGDSEARCSFDYYVKKTYNKTASLIANSCQSVAILGGQPPDVAGLAYDYGRHLGLAFQIVDDLLDFVGTSLILGKPALADLKQGIATAPVLFAAEEFPMMTDLIKRKFGRSGDVDQALAWVQQSRGLERTQELAAYHASQAVLAIEKLPPPDSLRAAQCRRALVDLTERVLTRRK